MTNPLFKFFFLVLAFASSAASAQKNDTQLAKGVAFFQTNILDRTIVDEEAGSFGETEYEHALHSTFQNLRVKKNGFYVDINYIRHTDYFELVDGVRTLVKTISYDRVFTHHINYAESIDMLTSFTSIADLETEDFVFKTDTYRIVVEENKLVVKRKSALFDILFDDSLSSHVTVTNEINDTYELFQGKLRKTSIAQAFLIDPETLVIGVAYNTPKTKVLHEK